MKRILKCLLTIVIAMSVVSVKETEAKPQASYVTYYWMFNYNRTNYDHTGHVTDAEKANTREAILNKNFRLALLTSLKREQLSASEQSTVRNIMNNPEIMQTSNGTFYGYLVKSFMISMDDNWDDTLDISDFTEAYYNKEKCLAYIEAAKKDGVHFPVSLDIPVYGNEINRERYGNVKTTVEATSNDQIILNIIYIDNAAEWYKTGYYCTDPEEMDYDIYIVGGYYPDRLYPEEMMKVFTEDYCLANLGLHEYGENAESDAIYDLIGLKEASGYIQKAEDTEEINKKLEYDARAEAVFLNNVIVIPVNTTRYDTEEDAHHISCEYSIMSIDESKAFSVLDEENNAIAVSIRFEVSVVNDESATETDGLKFIGNRIVAVKEGSYQVTVSDGDDKYTIFIAVVDNSTLHGNKDYGKVFNYEEYLTENRDVYEKYQNGEIGYYENEVFYYFVKVGIPAGQKGNFVFDPVKFRTEHYELEDYYGDNYAFYYMAYLNGYRSNVERVYGENRYQTSIYAGERLLELLGKKKLDTVIITTGSDYPDALSGSYLANIKNAPVLLIRASTSKISYEENVQRFVKDNLAENGKIYVLGGTTAVADEWLGDLNEKYSVKRLEGSNRYITNIEVLTEAGYKGGDILVATGKNYADCLSASAIDMPVLLVSGKLNAAQKTFLSTLKNARFHIVGGENAVSEEIETSLAGYGVVVERIAGSTRYETSVLLAEKFFNKPDHIVLAYGANYPDGLSGGSLAKALNAPLILVKPGNNAKYAIQYANTRNITKGIVLGGDTLIDRETVESVFGEPSMAVGYLRRYSYQLEKFNKASQ